MTTQDDDLKDGFGHSVAAQTTAGASMVQMYGAAPAWPEDTFPIGPFVPPTITPSPPFVIPPLVVQRPDGFTLVVTGVTGDVMRIDLSVEEWAKVRAAILGALR